MPKLATSTTSKAICADLSPEDAGLLQRVGALELFIHSVKPQHDPTRPYVLSKEDFQAALATLCARTGFQLVPLLPDDGEKESGKQDGVGDDLTVFGSESDSYLAIKNAHPRDARLQFDEEQHKYTIVHSGSTSSSSSRANPGSSSSSTSSGGSSSCAAGVRSVTSFCDGGSGGFNGNMIATRIIKSVRWSTDPTYEYYQKSKEEILRGWDFARDLGTELHRDIELFLNRKGYLEDCFLARKLTRARLLDSKTPDFVERTYFLAFLKDVLESRKWKPYRTEWRIFDEQIGIAGTIDFVVIPDTVLQEASQHDHGPPELVPAPAAKRRGRPPKARALSVSSASGTEEAHQRPVGTTAVADESSSCSSSSEAAAAGGTREPGAEEAPAVLVAATGGEHDTQQNLSREVEQKSGEDVDAHAPLHGRAPRGCAEDVEVDARQGIILIDWKRTKQVKKAVYRNQLNLYRYLLEKNYTEFRVLEMYVVRLHPQSESYDLCQIEHLPDTEVAGLLAT
eukprot:g133.t1